jgi:hypothetical protein
MQCDLGISVLEKICEIAYHWVVVCEGDPYLGLEGILLCECGKYIFELSLSWAFTFSHLMFKFNTVRPADTTLPPPPLGM